MVAINASINVILADDKTDFIVYYHLNVTEVIKAARYVSQPEKIRYSNSYCKTIVAVLQKRLTRYVMPFYVMFHAKI